jgi:hypothetical protein
MGENKIAAFYDDPLKKACDQWSIAKAHHFRSVSIDGKLYWQAQRWARFFAWLGRGFLRQIFSTSSGEPRPQVAPAPAASSSSSSSSSLSSST